MTACASRHNRLRLPLIAAPMFHVSGVEERDTWLSNIRHPVRGADPGTGGIDTGRDITTGPPARRRDGGRAGRGIPALTAVDALLQLIATKLHTPHQP